MSGKRKWSAAGAVAAMHRAYSGWDPTDPSVPIDAAHLVKARLDAIRDCIDVARKAAPLGIARERLLDFLATEQARLNPKRASERGAKR